MARLEKGYAVGNGLQDILPPPIQAGQAPTSGDIKFPLGQVWLDTTNGLSYILAKVAAGAATWNLMAPGASDVDTLSGDSGGNRPPTAGNIVIAGGTNITTAGAASTITVNLDDAIDLATSVTSPLYTSSGADLDVTAGTGFSVNISSDENAADAITLSASAGGIDITATGTAGEDIDITASGSSVNVTATEDAANAIYLHANGGTSETIKIHADQGTGVASIEVASDVGGLTLSSGLSSADAINITASAVASGIDIDAGTAGVIVDTTGGISLDAAAASNFTATGAFDVTLRSTAGSMIVNGGEAAADAVQITASDAAGGVTITAGTGNVNVAGNLVLSNVATQLQMNGGAVTDFIGTATLAAGTVTVANTNIAATDRIFIQRQDINGSTALGSLTYSISAATSFTITAVQDGTPAATETNDTSIVMYFIVRQN